MLLETISNFFRRVRTTNATDNGFPSRLPTLTKPSGTGSAAAQASNSAVIELGPGVAQNSVVIVPYGVGANNNTLSVRVIGWGRATDGSGPQSQGGTDLWIPVILAELACTLSSTPIGVTGGLLGATQLFADTITVTYGNANVSVEAVSPAADIIAHAILDLKGFELLEVTFTTGGSATSCNALVKLQ